MQYCFDGCHCQIYTTDDGKAFVAVGLVHPNVIRITSMDLDDLKLQFREAVIEMKQYSSENVTYFRVGRYSALLIDDGVIITGSIIKQNAALQFSADNFENATIAIGELIRKFESAKKEQKGQIVSSLFISVRDDLETSSYLEESTYIKDSPSPFRKTIPLLE